MSADKISDEDVAEIIFNFMDNELSASVPDANGDYVWYTERAPDHITEQLVAALAGRLLPAGGEERTEWRVTTLIGERHEMWEVAFTGKEAADLLRQAKAQKHRTDPRLWRHTITTYADGSVLTGPWVNVEEGS